MALIIPQLLEYVLRTINPKRAEIASPARLDDIESMIPRALQLLAEAVMMRPGDQYRLQKTYALSATAGVIPLSSFTDMLYETIPGAVLTHADSIYPLVYIRQLNDLRYPMSDQYGNTAGQYIYYAFMGDNLATRNFDGTLDTLSGDVTASNVGFVPVVHISNPVLTTVPVQLEDELITILSKMALRQDVAPSGR